MQNSSSPLINHIGKVIKMIMIVELLPPQTEFLIPAHLAQRKGDIKMIMIVVLLLLVLYSNRKKAMAMMLMMTVVVELMLIMLIMIRRMRIIIIIIRTK